MVDSSDIVVVCFIFPTQSVTLCWKNNNQKYDKVQPNVTRMVTSNKTFMYIHYHYRNAFF